MAGTVTRIVRAACWVVWALIAGLLVLNLDAGFHDEELVRALDSDEYSYAHRLLRAVETNSLNPRGHFNYGVTYFAFGLVLAEALGALGLDVETFHVAGLILRLLSLLSFAGMLVCLHRLLVRTGVVAVLAVGVVAVLAASPDLLVHAVRVHPDSTQLMLIAAGLLLAYGEYDRLRLTLAIALFGVAFGVKYSALFALPGVVVYAGMLALRSRREGAARELARLIASAVLAFAAGWLIPNWYVFGHVDELARDLAFESGRTTVKGFLPITAWHLWPMVVARQLSTPLALIVLLGFSTVLRDSVRTARGWPEQDSARLYALCLAAFALIGFGYLVLVVDYRAPRYFWPVLLPALVVAGKGLSRLLEHAQLARHREWLAVLVLVLATVNAAAGASRIADKRLNLYDSETWALAQAMPRLFGPPCAQTRLVVDGRTYVPGGYTQRIAFPVTRKSLSDTPEGIVISEATTGRLVWKMPGTQLADRRWQGDSHRPRAAEAREFLTWLASEESGYRLVYEDETHLAFRRHDAVPIQCERGITKHRKGKKKVGR